MSWWVYLEDETGRPVEVARHSEGGTYAVGGTTLAELNVTYNYGAYFYTVFGEEGLRETLHEKSASEILPLLERAYATLPDAPADDYWAATPGNAGHVLRTLLSWAEQHPEATFRVS